MCTLYDVRPPRQVKHKSVGDYIGALGLNQQNYNHRASNMSQELAKIDDTSVELSIIEQVVMQGDLSKLTKEQRVTYYRKVCDSAGLNPFTRPFDYINLNGKLTLYAKKDATEQLRKLNGISIEKLEAQVVDDLYIVKATARTRDGRIDASTGAVTIGNLKGDAKANAIMKAETKAKRRVTLSISGMGWVDETEIESIPNSRTVEVDLHTGEIKNGCDALVIEPKKKAAISADQAIDLQNILEECDAKYQEWVYTFLMEKYQIKSIFDIPVELFERIKLAAIQNMTKNHELQKAEFEKSESELLAVGV